MLLSEDRLPLLVTGGAGVTGYNALAYFSDRYRPSAAGNQVVGIRQKNNWRLDGPNIVACNAEDPVELARLFDQYRFKSVLNCAGNCALKACELDPRLAWRTNVEGITNLLAQVVEHQARLVHTSIDLVFSGDDETRQGHFETDRPDPVTVYGKTMVAAEQLISDWYPQACVLRISLPMGISFNGHAGAIDWIQSRYAGGRPATLYYDEIRTPTYTDCLNLLFEELLAGDLAGLFHSGGPRRLSLYEIAQIVNRVGGYDPHLLNGCPRFDAGPVPPRAGNVAMNSNKLAEAIGRQPFDPWPLDPAMVPTHREWHYERNGEAGTPELLAATLYHNQRRRGAES